MLCAGDGEHFGHHAAVGMAELDPLGVLGSSLTNVCGGTSKSRKLVHLKCFQTSEAVRGRCCSVHPLLLLTMRTGSLQTFVKILYKNKH